MRRRKKRNIPMFTKLNFGMLENEYGWDYRLHRSYITRKELSDTISTPYMDIDEIFKRYANFNKSEPIYDPLRRFINNYMREEEV